LHKCWNKCCAVIKGGKARKGYFRDEPENKEVKKKRENREAG
jgi:hypothetical protein